MRDIGACSFIFLAILTSTGCVPAIPKIEAQPPAEGRPDAPAPAPRDGGGDAPKFAGLDAAKEGGSAVPKESGLDATREAVTEAPTDTARDAIADASLEPVASDAPRTRAPRAGELAIVELLVDPAGNDLGHEWIELANLTDEALDLSTLHLSDETTDVAVDAGVLAARALLVLGQSIDRAHNGDAPVDRAYGTRLQLNNGGDRIMLCAGPCAEGATLATFGWTAVFGAEYAGHAFIIGPGASCPAADAYGTGGNFGTPGRINPPCPTNDASADSAGTDVLITAG